MKLVKAYQAVIRERAGKLVEKTPRRTKKEAEADILEHGLSVEVAEVKDVYKVEETETEEAPKE